MDDVKSFFASKTIWGGIMALLGVGLKAAGYDFPAEDQATLIEIATEFVPEIITTVGSVLAMYGRIVATKKIGA